jgi:hypothetical protein
MQIDPPCERRRRPSDEADRPLDACSVCQKDVRRAFDPSPLVPELRDELQERVFCDWFCAMSYCCDQYDDARPDLAAMVQQRFVAHRSREPPP